MLHRDILGLIVLATAFAGPAWGQQPPPPRPAPPSTAGWTLEMTADSLPSPAATQARHDSPLFFTPFPFSVILDEAYSPPSWAAAAVSTRQRYLIGSADKQFLSIGTANQAQASGVFQTYRDTLVKIFEAVWEPSVPGAFRLDSELHALYSLDVDATKQLVFRNNWGMTSDRSSGYLAFRYDPGTKRLQAVSRTLYDSSALTHRADAAFAFAGWYVHVEEGRFTLVKSLDEATALTFFQSPLDVLMPRDFNPDAIAYQPNDRVSVRNYLDKNRDDVESPQGKFHRDLGAQYQNQVSAVGNDAQTARAASAALDSIEQTLAAEHARLRYPKALYLAFREGALAITLQSDGIANGTLGMHTVPYVYFTNAADEKGNHHPFMVVASYSISDKPNRLVDVSRPPGDGTTGGYAEQKVTRDASVQLYLTKIPLKDYGLVAALTDNKLPRTLHADEHQPGPGSVYDYASTSAVGLAVDGVVIYPLLNNTLASAQESGEITSTGIHVGQGMGLHYHADGHTASNNDFNLYGMADYAGQTHPPLIGFALDGVALFGSYEKSFSGMEGALAALDEFGGHAHGALGYHYHAHLVKAKTAQGVPYVLHVLITGAWKGAINGIPEFWDDRKGEPAYSMGQHNRYVGMDERPGPQPPPGPPPPR